MCSKLNTNNRPIGFFDSGVGGISVLKEAVKVLPNENFVFFGDSKNAPIGVKPVEEIKKLTFNAVDFLLKNQVKAIVIACNTATSAAIEDIRDKYNSIPIIGIEPALKPAVELNKPGKILVMATPVTLSETKFSNLMKSFECSADLIPVPCAGLVELIESNIVSGPEMNKFLTEKLKPYLDEDISSVVLGCTHYPFIKEELSRILSNDTVIIDGSLGTSKQLKRQLEKYNLLSTQTSPGEVKIYSSSEDPSTVDMYYRFLKD